jgi:hypothetical protein
LLSGRQKRWKLFEDYRDSNLRIFTYPRPTVAAHNHRLLQKSLFCKEGQGDFFLSLSAVGSRFSKCGIADNVRALRTDL